MDVVLYAVAATIWLALLVLAAAFERHRRQRRRRWEMSMHPCNRKD